MTERKMRRASERFFARQLVPLSERLRVDAKSLFPGGPDPSESTYYVERVKRTMSREDFERGRCESPETLAAQLREFWLEAGSPELAELGPALGKLARALYRVDQQDAEVSPFMYVMY